MNYANINGNNMYTNSVMGVSGDINTTLAALQNIIIQGEAGQLSREGILGEIDKLVNMGLIRIVGQGTNRIVVETTTPLNGFLDFSEPAVIKIPYAIKKGVDDNLRELLLYKRLQATVGATYADPDTSYLHMVLPKVSSVRGYPILIAQEKITPIYMVPLVTSKKPDVNTLSETCSKVILNDFKAQYVKLMSALEKVCIFADLNAYATPLQFGIKNTPSGAVLTVLDTGYAIPKFAEMQLITQENPELRERRFLIIGRDLNIVETADNSGRREASIASIPGSAFGTIRTEELTHLGFLSRIGFYYDPNESVRGSKYVEDMKYFTDWYRALRMFSIKAPNSEVARYFAVLRGQKSSVGRI